VPALPAGCGVFSIAHPFFAVNGAACGPLRPYWPPCSHTAAPTKQAKQPAKPHRKPAAASGPPLPRAGKGGGVFAQTVLKSGKKFYTQTTVKGLQKSSACVNPAAFATSPTQPFYPQNKGPGAVAPALCLVLFYTAVCRVFKSLQTLGFTLYSTALPKIQNPAQNKRKPQRVLFPVHVVF